MDGIYIHIPFCIQKCIYCDFYSVTDISLEDIFVKSLIKEIKLSSRQKTKVDTIYFGGGTPSTISTKNIEKIIDAVTSSYEVDNHTEITIEVNPGTVSADKLSDYKKIGINRLNAGVQSFNNDNLKFLNRIHSANDAIRFIESARKKGFNNIGIDLIYCLPGQSENQWLKELNTAAYYKPEHISCYTLTYEDGTPLYSQFKKGNITPVGDDLSSILFETTIDSLASSGYHHYEISNFADSLITRSRHNYKYWDFISYRGFGPSAHSYEAQKDKRFWNVSNINDYMKQLGNNRLPIEETETLTTEQKMIEVLFLGFRKTTGINIDLFNTMFNADFNSLFKAVISTCIESGIITFADGHCCLTKKGILLADKIASMFVNELQ